jgi:tRNA nucleotidyltransferase (CCA-adding enzyme)
MIRSSRTPIWHCQGPPDGSRRGATVSALFYNSTSQKVEDFARTRLADLLVSRIIWTPLDPRQIFLNDPLRVLRLVRMSSKPSHPVEDQTVDLYVDKE